MTTIDLDTLVLDADSHDPGSDRMCVMEAVAMLAGEEWSDHPQCASPVIGAFLRSWNDSLPDADRQQLKQYIPRLINSRGTDDQEVERSWLATDWLVRVPVSYTPPRAHESDSSLVCRFLLEKNNTTSYTPNHLVCHIYPCNNKKVHEHKTAHYPNTA